MINWGVLGKVFAQSSLHPVQGVNLFTGNRFLLFFTVLFVCFRAVLLLVAAKPTCVRDSAYLEGGLISLTYWYFVNNFLMRYIWPWKLLCLRAVFCLPSQNLLFEFSPPSSFHFPWNILMAQQTNKSLFSTRGDLWQVWQVKVDKRAQ